MKQGKGTEWSEGIIIKEIWLYLLAHRAGEVGRYWRREVTDASQEGCVCAWLGTCAVPQGKLRPG